MSNVAISPQVLRLIVVLIVIALHSWGFLTSFRLVAAKSEDFRRMNEENLASIGALFEKYGFERPSDAILKNKEALTEALVPLFEKSEGALREGASTANSFASLRESSRQRVDAEDPFYLSYVYTFSSAGRASSRIAHGDSSVTVFSPGIIESVVLALITLWCVATLRTGNTASPADTKPAVHTA